MIALYHPFTLILPWICQVSYYIHDYLRYCDKIKRVETFYYIGTYYYIAADDQQISFLMDLINLLIYNGQGI